VPVPKKFANVLPPHESAMVWRVSGIVSWSTVTSLSRERSPKASLSTSTTLTSSKAPAVRPALRASVRSAYFCAIARMVAAL